MTKIFCKIISVFLVALTVLGLFGCNSTPERGTKDVIEDRNMVRIMSFNIRYNEYFKRRNIVPTLIGDYLPDSIGLQECTYQWYKKLVDALPEYGIVALGRDTGDISEECGEMSAILYRTDKYKLVDSGHFWISETPDEVSFGWDAACRRICTWVILENIETQEQYAHVNLHLDHEGQLARQNGVELIVEKALSYDLPTVVTGDFNFNSDTDLYETVISSGLHDAQDLAVDTMTGKTYHGYSGGEEGLPIDFIFVNSKIESVSTYKIVRDKYNNKYTSDHYPIYADVVFCK